ncbi:MAG: NADPH-dependent oxidoreductase [Alphaproteobacteria bacterium]
MPDDISAAERPLTSDTIETLANRVSVRAYTDEPVTDEQVDAVLRAAFRAPTSSNIQSYSVVVVRDEDTLAKLAVVTKGQKHVEKAPVFLAFCADLTRIDVAVRSKGGNIDSNNLETGLVSSVDAALVGMSAYIAADSLGMKGVMIGAVRNDAVETAKILGLPKRVYCVFGMVLGWPDEAPPQKPRMGYETVVHYEQYGRRQDGGAVDPAIAAYDAALRAHYESVGKTTTPDSWSHDMGKKFMPEPRQGLRAQLAEQGFDFI